MVHFAWWSGSSLATPELFLAAISAAVSYAEGGRLAREMPGWRVMAWALVLALPVTLFGFAFSWTPINLPTTVLPWAALLCLALISQFVAFWFWYRALAAGVSRTSQLQLLQPFFTLLLAYVLLGESIPTGYWLYTAAAVVTVQLARRRSEKTLRTVEEVGS